MITVPNYDKVSCIIFLFFKYDEKKKSSMKMSVIIINIVCHYTFFYSGFLVKKVYIKQYMVFFFQYLFRFNCISTMNTINVLVLLLAVFLAAEAGKTSILLCVTIKFELNDNFKLIFFISVNILI